MPAPSNVHSLRAASRLCAHGNLTPDKSRAYFRLPAPQFPARMTKMLMQPNSYYRYYYYYGSLSARRDGAAKDCRRVLSM
jgi:hypothetical protein